ncbi:MAG: MBL fold metallo-hydrolase [Glaciecola sp.]
MQVSFYGVRGSIPTPGLEFSKFGGNTACTHVLLSDGTDIVLDAGTGIRALGKKLAQKQTPIHLLLSHNHWDHIQGFPFFAPIYQAKRKINVTPGQTDEHRPEAFLEQMAGSFFPVPSTAIAAEILINAPTQNQWNIGNATISRLLINHPGGGSCYSIVSDGKKVVYMTDNELYPPYKKNTDFLTFVEFAKNADLLIHDAQYIINDMPAKSGWGHSVAEEAIKLALAANAKRLALYSHDPERTDSMVDDIVEHAADIITIGGGATECFGAKEIQQLTL